MTSSVRETSAPVLTTARLRLRGHRADDLDAAMPMWSDPITTRFIGGRPYTREEVWQRIQRYAGSWALLGFGFWAVEDVASGRIIGEVGVMDAKRDIDPQISDELEMGWALGPGVRGQGYASEAVGAVLGWVESNLGAPRLVAMIAPENEPSLRLAGKFGFVERVRTTYRGEPSIILERAGAVWRAQRTGERVEA